MAIITARSDHWRPNSMSHSPRDLTSRAMTSWKETRPPLSHKICLTRNESSYQLVSFNKFKLSNFVWELSRHLWVTPKGSCVVLRSAETRFGSGYLALLSDWISQKSSGYKEIWAVLQTAPRPSKLTSGRENESDYALTANHYKFYR